MHYNKMATDRCICHFRYYNHKQLSAGTGISINLLISELELD